MSQVGWASNRIQHHSGIVYSCCNECYYFSNVACVASKTTNFSNISWGVCIAAVMSASNVALTVEPLYCGHLGDIYTVEPPNNGHIGDRSLVLCREVVPISEVVPERVWLREISH